jgi:phosphopantothenoylcysteine decarboxylase/phosphopantothenate--cysteine ligase
VAVIEPDEGPMACGEYGPGRLPEPAAIVAAVQDALRLPADGSEGEKRSSGALAGRHILVTAGPTHEPIDPVRYIANRSSGKQGFAIAGALAARGARVTLVAGPVELATPKGVDRIDVETAAEMAAAVDAALPADAAVLVAAVADWRVEAAAHKIKKGGETPSLTLLANPDILAGLAEHADRPGLLVGFAAETRDVIANAVAKRAAKGCDWIVANDVSGDVMGGANNAVHVVTADGVESWERLPKPEVASRLADRIADALA